MKKIIALLLTLVLTALCFAGCQMNEKTIVVGYTKYPPMNYEENGKLVGFDTELAEKVFTNLGYKVSFKEIQWDSKYTDLDAGTIDCVWNGFTCNTADSDGVQRSEKVDFSYKYMENRQVIVIKKDAGIQSAADLSGKQGGAEKGSAGESYIGELENVTYKGFTSQMDCLFEVNAGTIDFGVMDALLVESLVGKGDYADLTIVDSMSGDKEFYAIGFKKGSELTAKVNAELEKLAADGYLMELAEKYKVDKTVVTDFADQKK